VEVPPTYNAELIATFQRKDADARFHIPSEIATVDVAALELFKSDLHMHQRFSAEIDNIDVLDAIHTLLGEYDQKIASIQNAVPPFVPLDLSSEEALTVMLNKITYGMPVAATRDSTSATTPMSHNPPGVPTPSSPPAAARTAEFSPFDADWDPALVD
jgi:trimethylamine:corrinoid methyltransferase-like protein